MGTFIIDPAVPTTRIPLEPGVILRMEFPEIIQDLEKERQREGVYRFRIGFTGSRKGMSEHQIDQLYVILSAIRNHIFLHQGIRGGVVLHHGDADGSDAEAHEIALGLGYEIVIHPPLITRWRAFCPGFAEERPAKPFGKRDEDIVKETDFLIAAPMGGTEQLRSGTWQTIRISRRLERPRIILPRR